MKRWLCISICSLWCLLTPGLAQNAPAVGVDDIWARLQDDKRIAIYMILTARQATRLTGAASPVANRVELQTHVTVNNTLQTRPVAGIDLPKGVKVRLEPGGLHVQLLDVSEGLIGGQLIPLTLRFTDGSELTLRAALH